MKQASIRGFSGVLVNYTNGFPASFTALVYLDLVNSEGQTAGVSLGTCGFQGNQTVSCFVTLPISVPTGNYTAWIFATSLANVPVSIESSIRVSA